MNTGKTLLGIVAGLATGAVLGVLFAPNKGCDTRRKIAKKSKHLKEEVNHKYQDIVNNISGKIDDLEYNAEAFVQKGKDMINKI